MSSDSDSDDELGAFSFMNKIIEVEQEPVVVEQADVQSDLCTTVESLFILRDLAGLEGLLATKEGGGEREQCEVDVIQMAIGILSGKHVEVVESLESGLSVSSLLAVCKNDQNKGRDVPLQIRDEVFSFLEQGESETERVCRVVQCFLLAVAYLELYCQQNYTGPELEPSVVNRLHGFAAAAFDIDAIEHEVESLHKESLPVLECDGCYVFSMSVIPHTLVIARSILLFLSNPDRASWHHGIELSDSGEVLMAVNKEAVPPLVSRSLRIMQVGYL